MAHSESKDPSRCPSSQYQSLKAHHGRAKCGTTVRTDVSGRWQALFAARCYTACVKKWQDTLTFVDHCITQKSGVTPDEARSNRLRVVLHSNIAAAHLKQGGEVVIWAALAACNKALHIDAAEAKAIFRKGVACSRWANWMQHASVFAAWALVPP